MNNQPENNVPGAFPHNKAIRRRFDWGMHHKLFAGGSKRLTPKAFRAYMGYLLVLFLMFLGIIGIPAALIALGAAFSGVLALQVLAGFMAVFIFCGFLWFLQNAFWGFLYRFHDMGFGGWWLFFFYLIAYALDKTSGYLLAGMGLYVSVGVFSALLGLAPYVVPGKTRKNEYGFPVEYRWYSFPTPVRICGEIMFWLAVAFVALEVLDILTASTTPPKSILMDMLFKNDINSPYLDMLRREM